MNRKLLFFCAATFPFFLVFTVVQSIQYRDLEKVVRNKEKAQHQWIEKNRKMMVGIMILSSPQRIDRLAEDQLGLKMVTDKQVRIRFTDE